MASFTVALVSVGGQPVPDWVAAQLAAREIELRVEECETRADLVRLAADADLVWVFSGSRVVSAESLVDLPRCRAILRTGAGTDNVPVAAATAAGIVVATTPEAGTQSVADHAVALLMAAVRQVPLQDRLMRTGVWDPLRAAPRWTLRNESIGLVGFGRIAQALTRNVRGFDMTVLAYDPLVDDQVFADSGVRRADLAEVLTSPRIVSLHCPLTPETHHLIGEAELGAMRSDAVLINVSRGPLVDEDALCRALAQGSIQAAGLDVFEAEPLAGDSPLLALDNVVITPHVAAYSETFYRDSWKQSVQTVLELSDGRWPPVCANPEVVPRWPLR
jgi:D-3-phosphoglycerate dehydrogenase